MSTISLRANITLIFFAMAGMVASLQLPWFAPTTPPQIDASGAAGPTNVADSLAREFTGQGFTGFTIFKQTDNIFYGLALLVAIAALLATVKFAQDVGRRLLALSVLGCIGFIVAQMFIKAGPGTQLDLRCGPWAALLACLIALSAARAVWKEGRIGTGVPPKRRITGLEPERRLEPAPPLRRRDTSDSSAPPPPKSN